jgi:hypothetical protein
MDAATALHLGRPDPSWGRLAGARVSVFEDAVKGLHSASEALGFLKNAGVFVELQFYGITQSPPKRRALKTIGANLYPDLSAGLAAAIRP